jgi:hypothetical protein
LTGIFSVKLLIIDMYNNGLFMAEKLVRTTSAADVEKVFLLSQFIRPSMWVSDRLEVITEKLTVEQVVELVQRERISLVANFSSLYGVAGVLEAIEKIGVACIGSNRAYSQTEIGKRDFRRWLIDNGFSSPQIYFEGMFDDIAAKASEFTYPLVIKPDSQIGPKVAVCHDQVALEHYLQTTAEAVPYTKFAVVFLIEEYVPLIDNLYVVFYLCNGHIFISDTTRLPLDWKGTRNAGECAYALVPNPLFEHHRAEITAAIEKMKTFTQTCIGIMQCGVSDDGKLYFIESNARPATAALGSFEKPLSLLLALRDGDHDTLGRLLDARKANGASIALMHREDKIKVDIDTLNNLEGFSYSPNSIEKEADGFYSHRKGAPSMLHVHGETLDEIIERLEKHLPTIQATGDYLSINPDSIRRLHEHA